MLYPCLGTAALGGAAGWPSRPRSSTPRSRRPGSTGNVQSVAWSLLNRSLAALMAGDLELARRTAEESVELVGELGDSFVAQPRRPHPGVGRCSSTATRPGRPTLMVAAGGGDDLPRVAGGWRTTYLEVLVALLAGRRRRRPGPDRRRRRRTRSPVRSGLPRSPAMAHRAAAEVALHEGAPTERSRRPAGPWRPAESSAAHLDAAIFAAKTRSTPSCSCAISSSRSSRLTYASSDSRRAPGRPPEMASAAWVSTASTVRGSTSLWCASMACTTSSCSPYLRARSAPTIACVPSTSWVSALPMSCRNAPRLTTSTRMPELGGHQPGQVGGLDQVLEHVLAVRRPEPQLAEQRDQLGVDVGDADLDQRVLAGALADRDDLGAAALVLVLDPLRVDPPVEHERLEREPRHLAPDRVERRQQHRLGGVVDDEVDAGHRLERADVAALPADDAALHLLAGQVDDRHHRLGGLLRGQPLDRAGDDGARALLTVLASARPRCRAR